jgi:hypothetical protein
MICVNSGILTLLNRIHLVQHPIFSTASNLGSNKVPNMFLFACRIKIKMHSQSDYTDCKTITIEGGNFIFL